MSKTAIGLAALIGVLVASAASAGHNEPKKATLINSKLVTNYNSCTAPNDTTTGALPLPACHPAVRNDTVCGFDPTKGSGFLKAIVVGSATGGTQDIKVIGTLTGLDAGCEGETLCALASIRATGDNCASADPGGCTTLEGLTQNFPLFGGGNVGCCTVASGKCQIKTTVETALGIDLFNDNHLGLRLQGCGVRRVTGASLPSDLSFSCGLLVP
jgi:hypothetical protein